MNNAPAPTDDASPEAPAQLTDWNNEPTIETLINDLTAAKTETDQQILKIDEWLNHLNITGSVKLPESKSRSTVQPKLIRKQAEWRYPSLSEPFLSTPDLFNVSPVTFEDKQAAVQNELVLNYQFNNVIDKVSFIDDYVRTGVDEGTIIVRTGWEYQDETVTTTQPVYEYVANTDSVFTQMLQQAMAAQQSNPEQYETLPDTLKMSLAASTESGTPIEVREVGVEEVEQTKVIRNQPTAEVCDPRNVILDPTARGKMKDARFVIYRFETSLAELKAAGHYQNLDQIHVNDQQSPLAEPDYEEKDNSNFNFKDEPRKRFIAYEYWGFWDINGDGLLKPFVATWVGKTMIRLEESPFSDGLPFVVVPYLPRRRSFYGEPDGELTQDNQKIVGAVTRGMIDIMASTAAGQRGYRRDALDPVNARRFKNGQDFMFNPTVDPRLAFHTQTFPEIPQSAQFVLAQQNADAESLTGIQAFSGSGLNGQSLGESATGIRGALNAASTRELAILRRLAKGIVEIGKKFIAMNAEFLSDEEIIRVTNEKFVAIKREELAGNFDLRLTISSAEEDNAKAQELAFMLQTTGPSSDPGEVRMIRAEIARLRKMPDLAKRIEEYQPQPDPLEIQKQQLEIALLQAQIADLQGKAQENAAQAVLHQAKAQEALSKTELNELDKIEQEMGVKQERELQKQGEQAKANAKLELVKHSLQQADKSDE